MSNPAKKKKARPITDFDVVFSDKGDLAWNSWISQWQQQQGTVKTEKNHAFTDSLEYAGYAGSHIMFKSLTSGRMYHMFMSDFDETVTQKRFVNNQIVGVFCFCRRGQKQGVRLIFEP